ncbi:MAG: ATP-dependent DNA helicase RecQ [Flavobacterium sp.]|jgi:ATP-dependent DNA helicase RecQ
MSNEALLILQKHWKHEKFRQPQEQIIQNVLEGKDSLALLPTGGGKSICYQVPGMMLNGICLVISPLIALIKDQVENLEKKNIKAIALLGGISPNETSNLLDNCEFGNYKFLYISPERLQQDWVLERIKKLPVNLIAIDEAHCVSQWGHDFRPAYLKINVLKEHFNRTPFIALTASATLRVQKDIIENLKLDNVTTFTSTFKRDNLSYYVVLSEDKLHKIEQILNKNKQSSIIYVRNRRSCIETSENLNKLGYSSTFYHGGLSVKDKNTNMKKWMNNECQVMVATNAFGMGIDKPDVKTVIHIQLPENIENYYQEAGRAGRNEEKAFAILILSPGDIETAKNQFIEVLPNKKFLKEVYHKLNSFFQIAYGEGYNSKFSFNLNQFCSQYKLPVIKTYNALQFLDRQSIITLNTEFSEKTSIQFVLESKEVIRYMSLHKSEEEIITNILRTYTGIFDIETNINTVLIAKKSHVSENEVIKTLENLQQNDCIIISKLNNDSSITFNEIREDDLTINRVSKYLENQNNLKTNQFKEVINYINKEQCKTNFILNYFDEKTTENCGICSYCVSLKKSDTNSIQEQIIELLQKAPFSSREIENQLTFSTKEILNAIQNLLELEKIKINKINQYTLI